MGVRRVRTAPPAGERGPSPHRAPSEGSRGVVSLVEAAPRRVRGGVCERCEGGFGAGERDGDPRVAGTHLLVVMVLNSVFVAMVLRNP